MVLQVLKELSVQYPHINYSKVLSQYPKEYSEHPDENTIVFDGIESSHPRYAIVKRNEYMINISDTVVCYVKYTGGGGAVRFVELAKKKGKQIINLAQ